VTLSYVMLKTLLMDGVTNSVGRIGIRSRAAQNGVMVLIQSSESTGSQLWHFTLFHSS